MVHNFDHLSYYPYCSTNMISEEKIYSTSTRLLIEDDSPQILNIKEITAPDKSMSFFKQNTN